MIMLIFFHYRYKCFSGLKNEIEKNEGGLEKFSRGYERFGINRTHEGVVYREWAPAARGVYLIGDFSKWLTWFKCACLFLNSLH